MRMLTWLVALIVIAASGSGCSSSSSAQSMTTVVDELVVPGIVRSVGRLDSGLIIFVLEDDIFGAEPWVTDGTEVGTFQLAETMAGNFPGSSTPGGVLQASAAAGRPVFTPHGNRAYFFTQLGDLWETDGTISGTFMSIDMTPDGFSFAPDAFYADGNDLIVGGCESPLDGIPPINTPCTIKTIILD